MTPERSQDITTCFLGTTSRTAVFLRPFYTPPHIGGWPGYHWPRQMLHVYVLYSLISSGLCDVNRLPVISLTATLGRDGKLGLPHDILNS